MTITIAQIQKMIPSLEEMQSKIEEGIEAKEEALSNAESADYPNEDRLSKLTEQIDVLSNAADDLASLIDHLQEYES